MSRFFQKTKEISKIKNHICKIAPEAVDIDIKVKILKTGRYKTLIKVHLPDKKFLVAEKKDETIWDSMDKAHNAIVKQIDKFSHTKYKKPLKELALEVVA